MMRDYLKNINLDKIEKILEIKKLYNSGKLDLQSAKAKLKSIGEPIKPYEIAFAEQEFEKEEPDQCRKENIKNIITLFEDVMDISKPKLEAGHPIECYYRENEKMKELLLSVEDLVQYPVIKNQWLELYEELIKFRIHLSRKQNQLYSILEKKGFDRPTTTMWLLDDFIRNEITSNFNLIKEDKDEEFISLQMQMVSDIRDLIEKEETILYPTSLYMISDDEFEEMKEGDKEIGFAWIDVEPKKETLGKSEINGNFISDLSSLLNKYGLKTNENEKLNVSTGKLTLEQINLIFKNIPVDLSYVDEDDIVSFYSDTKHRVFPRSKNVIGRKVQNCHPRTSVHIVDEIIEKFRSGEENSVDFWINKPNLFIYITYRAIRDDNGKFRGVLEMMQDCTLIRSLEGSRTLLSWSSGNREEIPSHTENNLEEINNNNDKPDLDVENIDLNTKLKDLLYNFPQLKENIESINPKFRLLKTPLAKVMLAKATISTMAERSGMDVKDLIDKIKNIINHKVNGE